MLYVKKFRYSNFCVIKLENAEKLEISNNHVSKRYYIIHFPSMFDEKYNLTSDCRFNFFATYTLYLKEDDEQRSMIRQSSKT